MAERALLPKPADLAKLTERQTEFVLKTIDQANQREMVYARLSLIFGFVCFLADLTAFVFLIETDHATSAGVVLGTGVLAIVGKFLASRLQK